MRAMQRGDFAAAWRVSDFVLRERLRRGVACSHWPRHLQFVWTGAPLAGKRVLVRCYHGLGDTIQFIRLAEPLRRLAQHVTVWAQPELIELVATVRGVDRVLPLHDDAPAADYDVDIEIMELAHALRITPATLPRAVPYLSVPTVPARDHKRAGALRVGMVWQAGDWDPGRSIPIEALEPIARQPGVELFSLQRGPARRRALDIGATDISTEKVAETARGLQALDLIICVDTMLAHLSGALGLNVWTLLKADCDWRWMRSGERSLWYPTMQLFRQREAGRWDSVIESVCRRLAAIHPAEVSAGASAPSRERAVRLRGAGALSRRTGTMVGRPRLT
jgi:hypothetical protein